MAYLCLGLSCWCCQNSTPFDDPTNKQRAVTENRNQSWEYYKCLLHQWTHAVRKAAADLGPTTSPFFPYSCKLCNYAKCCKLNPNLSLVMQPTWQTTCFSVAAMSCLPPPSVSAGLLSVAAFEGCFHFLGVPLPVSDHSEEKKGVRACKVSPSLNGIPNCDFAFCTSSAAVHANTSAIFKCSPCAGRGRALLYGLCGLYFTYPVPADRTTASRWHRWWMALLLLLQCRRRGSSSAVWCEPSLQVLSNSLARTVPLSSFSVFAWLMAIG